MRLSGLTIAATLGAGFAVAACGPSVTSPWRSRPAVAADPIDLTDPTAAAAEARLLAAWRPAPLPISDDLRDSIAFLCRNAGDADANAAMAKLDVAVVDARGAGLASMILADDTVAFECRVKLETVGGTLGATIIEAPSRLAPSSAESLGDDGIPVVSPRRVDEVAGP